MPSSTFFRLPEAKRSALLRCAREEFSRVPFPDASINQIIRAAGIPRGSFYMYFTDKADLFSYLMGQYAQHLSSTMAEQLKEHDGNLFEAHHALFEHILSHYRTRCQKDNLEEIISILHRNKGLPYTMFQQCAGQVQLDILPHLNLNLLHLEREGDVEDILRILLQVTVPLICQGLIAEDPSPIQVQYHNILDILKRGIASDPAAAARQL